MIMPRKRWLAALPVFNEQQYIHEVLDEVGQYASHVLVVNDGSSDNTGKLLAERADISVITHPQNRGYGAALKSAFQYAIDNDYETIVTLDCDGQHQPQRIPRFVAACENVDIVSGSRYLKIYEGDSAPPAERLFINRQVTKGLNQRFGLNLTDAFCGFKAYRVEAIKAFQIADDGYAMPLELWVQAAMLGMSVLEVPVPLIYLDLNRSFGGSLDQANVRLAYYNSVIDQATDVMIARGYSMPNDRLACSGCS
jgi:glycosyltransferase involved in cell wall biosynthesis